MHKYSTVTEALFKEDLHCWVDIFVTQERFEEDLVQRVREKLLARGEIIVSRLVIATEPLCFLAFGVVEEICKKNGFRVEKIENKIHSGKYLGSDGYGRFSSDFYDMVQYGAITITAA
jgi:hypothetical protein